MIYFFIVRKTREEFIVKDLLEKNSLPNGPTHTNAMAREVSSWLVGFAISGFNIKKILNSILGKRYVF